MRIALINFKNIERNEIFDNIDINISELIYLDNFEEDMKEAEYCIDIRSYDLILINYLTEHKKFYVNMFGSINRKYKLSNKVVFVEQSTRSNLNEFLAEYTKIYKNVNTKTTPVFYERSNLLQFLSKIIYDTFILSPNIQNVSIDYENKIINVVINDINIPIKAKRVIDYKILTYFIRHYGDIINLDCILSAIAEEPEYYEPSIESSITNIRKTFKSYLNKNPIKSFKKIGYRFQI